MLLDVPWLGTEHDVQYRGAVLAWGPFAVDVDDTPAPFFGKDLQLWNGALLFVEAERQDLREWPLKHEEQSVHPRARNGTVTFHTVDHGTAVVRALRAADGQALAGQPSSLRAVTAAVRELLGL